ncbi:hypothetical protein IAQ61_006712 [Plenodomus lingam]|uniref:uncharacterized protein n=1 Tax=Leptosphaeria maculans TaxID=5022 RepID=UPI0033227CD2|nr:hypothetical protein IAQ61_006712 [Plenodomus lingam]
MRPRVNVKWGGEAVWDDAHVFTNGFSVVLVLLGWLGPCQAQATKVAGTSLPRRDLTPSSAPASQDGYVTTGYTHLPALGNPTI